MSDFILNLPHYHRHTYIAIYAVQVIETILYIYSLHLLTLGATLVTRRKTSTRMWDPQGCHVSGLCWRLTCREQLGVCIRVATRPAFHTLWSTTTLGGHAFPGHCWHDHISPRTLLTQYMRNLNDIVSMFVHITPSEFPTFPFIHFTTTIHICEQHIYSRVPDFTDRKYHISVTHDIWHCLCHKNRL